jgi:hypothetical protein
MFKRRLCLVGFSITSLCAMDLNDNAEIPPDAPDQPWITGPLLTPVGNVVKEGHGKYQPYLYWINNPAIYDHKWKSHTIPTFHSVIFQTSLAFGIAKAIEFTFIPQVAYHRTEGEQAIRQGDLPFLFGFQLLKEEIDGFAPAIKLRLSGDFPIGKYQRSNPKKLKTDLTGLGSWDPGVSLIASKRFHLSGYRWLIGYLFAAYEYATPVHVHGISLYGGTTRTRGTVYPGSTTTVSAALELTLTKHFGFTLDAQYQHFNKNRFKGRAAGYAPKFPSSEQFALAPAAEYNFSQRLGMITGAWFTVAGRNGPVFASWIFAINIYR